MEKANGIPNVHNLRMLTRILEDLLALFLNDPRR